ncbi:MAG: fatty acid desaturase [Planctomycetes bacterium]|nr:fatty acid desaturase [Planctomycetota bacterium]NUQ34993.1 fatty acid desaturase [Planctomycetaceae bacterium]
MTQTATDDIHTEEQQYGSELVAATSRFAREIRAKSWWHFGSTFAALIACLVAAALIPWWPVRAAAAIIGGLTMVRAFIIYHDVMHGSILRKSIPALIVMYIYGLLTLSPPSAWRRSHNFHHAAVGKVSGSGIGSFPVMTVAEWKSAGAWQRFIYRVNRHPLTILSAYMTVFFYNNTLKPFVRRPLQNWDAACAVVLHAGVIVGLWLLGGPLLALFAFMIPYALSAVVGAYLFYAQHNYAGVDMLPPEKWSYHKAALRSSSYMKLGPLMNWFTGNIGYHHIHHVNMSIPFYRLKETMSAIPALQRAGDTSLRIRDVISCLSLKLWDEQSGRMISFRDLRVLVRA